MRKKKNAPEKTDTSFHYSIDEVEEELNRLKRRKSGSSALKRILLGLGTAAAAAVIVSLLFLPVLRTQGSSMTPTLYEGNLVVSFKGADYKQGDVVSFYYNNKILVKRVIAFAGDWVSIDDDGSVSVNGEYLDEPYVQNPSLGDCDITFPYQVPDGDVFVLGDHRSTSKDSRSNTVGPVPEDKIVGKIIFRIWPLNQIGTIQ